MAPAKSNSKKGGSYPELNKTSSRQQLAAALEADGVGLDIEIAPKEGKKQQQSMGKDYSPEEISLTDTGELLSKHASHRRKGMKGIMSKAESGEYSKRRAAMYFMCVLIFGIILPIGCIVMIALLLEPDTPGGQWPYALAAPAAVSLSVVALISFRERGPGGVLEKRGYKPGCLPCTAIQPEEK